jgi:ATP-dependent helicase HepA
LRTTEGDKILLICRSQAKAVALEAALRKVTTLPVGLFHEGMTLVQRDRSAAWFAEPDGARLLICSEIGSEGRNFQFAHHLVLFDLPQDPGLLEQRIGRLDRIGQRAEIQIHVPIVAGTHLEVLARWYHEGLDAFATNVAGGRELMETFAPSIRQVADGGAGDSSALDALVASAASRRVEVGRRLSEGRDRLLELNSFKPAVAERVVAAIQACDADVSLDDFMLRVFDHFFIGVEQLAPRTWRLNSAGVLRDAFPGLSSDGVAITADRNRALVREEQQFLTWDHPLASGAIDLLLGGDHGNCGAARWRDASANALYLESIYVLECVAPAALHAGRFLPPTVVRVVVDHRGGEATAKITAALEAAFEPAPDAVTLTRRPEIRDRLLPKLVERGRLLADAQVPRLVASARERMEETLGREETRLRGLQEVNPSVRQSEIEMLVAMREDLRRALDGARLRLDAVRVIHRAQPND